MMGHMEPEDTFTDDLLIRLSEIDAKLTDINDMYVTLERVRRTIIRWVWQHNGWSTREASRHTGIPRSTLHRWHMQGDWHKPMCP